MWDSSEAVAESWNQTIDKLGESRSKLTVEDIKAVMGLTIEAIAAKFFPNLDDNQRLNIVKQS